MSDTTSNKEYIEMTSERQVFETDKLNSKGGTEADAQDMEMLGRTQVLNVSLLSSPRSPISLQLPPSFLLATNRTIHSAISASCRRSASHAH